jgi:hypothetical protein
MNLELPGEYRVRLVAAAAEREMTVAEFVTTALERALRPLEARRRDAMREVLELEALWSSENERTDRPRFTEGSLFQDPPANESY